MTLRINTDPTSVWAEYERCKQYNSGIDLDDTVKKNEDFFLGRQWEGVKAPDLEKPVLNMLKRVVTYFVSMIVSDDVSESFSEFRTTENGDITTRLMTSEVDRVIERTKAKSKNRLAVRNAAVDGDCAAYFWFDPEEGVEGRVGAGEIRMDLMENTRVMFGNPYNQEVQEQPYVLIVKRSLLDTIRERAEKRGRNPEAIQPDEDMKQYGEENNAYDLVTSVVKLYKQDGTIWHTEITRDAVVYPPTNTGCKLYPISWMCWETVKNSYHGQAAITGLIPNQILVNKLWAMAAEHQKSMAFPKLFYDSTRIKNWTNKVGEAIKVNGSPNDVFSTSSRGGDMSSQVLEMVERTVTYTRDFMGASDAALGNIKPDNTSAIIAVQKASSAPLELQRMAFYQFVEDGVRIILDLICTHYGVREIGYTDDDGTSVVMPFDFSQARNLDVKVDVGAASYWSELTQLQTMDNLFSKGLTDSVTYLESIPSQYVPRKNKLLEKLKEKMQTGISPEMGGENGAMPKLPQQPIH